MSTRICLKPIPNHPGKEEVYHNTTKQTLFVIIRNVETNEWQVWNKEENVRMFPRIYFKSRHDLVVALEGLLFGI
jgi:hypothetical protein